jgi:peptide/nickel transport system substrate-binding protein
MPRSIRPDGRSRPRPVLILLVLAALLGLASVPAAAQDASPTPGGSLRVGLSVEPDTLDPAASAQASAHQVFMQIYDTLVWLDPDTGEYAPGLAESWDIADDGLSATFHLRDGVTFQDGTPFDAEAVKYTFERILDPEFTSPTARAKLGSLTGVTVVDPLTVTLEYSAPYAALLNGLSQHWLGIVSPTAAEQYGADFGKHPVGTGSMSFVEWVPGDHITLARNPAYAWAPPFMHNQGGSYLDDLTFTIVSDNTARSAGLEAGDLDVVWNLPAADFDRLSADDRFTVTAAPWSGGSLSLFLNTELSPTDDLAVRQAILQGINRQDLIDLALFGIYAPAEGPISPITQGYSPTVEGKYPYDPDAAGALLDGAGWTMGGDGLRHKDDQTLGLHIITIAQFEPIATTIQGLLRPLGFDVQVDVRDAAAAVDANSKGEGTGGITGLVDSDPAGIQLFYDSANYGGFDWSRVQDPEIDGIIAAQASELDPDARNALLARLQDKIMDEALIYPLYQGAFLYGVRDGVEDFHTNKLAYPYYADVWLGQ